ncbi:MAG: hypothetical protein V3U72_03935, partial [Candidatus Aenigmarchaeota archaeon]
NRKISSHDFGQLDPASNESGELNMTVSNIDTKIWTGVKERSEVYRVDTRTDKNVTGDYYFLVPHFATKVKAKIEWKGETHWYISLNDSDGNFRGNSSGKYRTGNKTDTVQEENILHSGTINTDNDGLWKLTVGNVSAISDNKYNITVYTWHDSSSWVSSDYPSAGFNFNSSLGSDNSSKNVSVKITLPSTNISNGSYEGFIEYYKPTGWIIQVPISFRVKAGTLMVNGTLNSVTETKNDNIGFNRLGANVLTLTLPINNTGGHNISFVNTTSNYTLYKGSYHMNFTVALPSNPIQAGSNDTIKINISINVSDTGNSAGLYSGWIRLNTTNSSYPNASSYPFNVFDINIRVNLSSSLIVNITAIEPVTVPQVENNTNMTLNITVRLSNGSIVSRNEIINRGDFYNVYLKETNRSYTTLTTFQNLTISATGGTWSVVCPSGGYNLCRLNGTLLSGRPGGRYYALATVRLNTSRMGGTGINITGSTQSSIQTVISDEGLYIVEKYHRWVNRANPLDEGDDDYYTVYIKNYGPLTATRPRIMFNNPDSCLVSIVADTTNSTCMGTSQTNKSGVTWTVTSVPGYMWEDNCSVTWKVTASAVTVDKDSCQMNIGVATAHGNFGNLTGVYVEVHDNTSAGSPGGPGGGPPPAAECSTDSDCATTESCVSGSCTSISCPNGYVKDHTCYSYANEFLVTGYEEKVYMMQGGYNSTNVTVKNQGGYTRVTKLDAILNLTGLTIVVDPTSYTLASGNSGVFKINFSATNATEIGYHKLTLKVYVSGNQSIHTTKNITIAIQPLEETKRQINQTRDDLKDLFASLISQFNQISPSTEANYTLANRTYQRLLNMFKDIEDKIGLENYMEAYSLLKETNSSLAEFRQQIGQVMVERGQIPLDMLTLVAIITVIVIIGGFLVYLLLPPKKGFHHAFGYVPKKKMSATGKLKRLFSRTKKVKGVEEDQKTLGEYEKRTPAGKKPAQAEKPPGKKTYMEGYQKSGESQYSYGKMGLKPKKIFKK